jgi:hypothetical protein
MIIHGGFFFFCGMPFIRIIILSSICGMDWGMTLLVYDVSWVAFQSYTGQIDWDVCIALYSFSTGKMVNKEAQSHIWV